MAYRFLGNERIDWRDMMLPHWDRTTARMGQLPVVLCIADTTELNFNGQDIEGAGPLNCEAQVGMYLHASYATTPDREPLGVMHAWMWARQPRDANGRCGGVRESVRWIESYEIVAEQARTLGATHFLTRTLGRVSSEMSLQVLACNLKRDMNILGVARTIRL